MNYLIERPGDADLCYTNEFRFFANLKLRLLVCTLARKIMCLVKIIFFCHTTNLTYLFLICLNTNVGTMVMVTDLSP